MKCINELSAEELKGKRVLLRSDFNVPLTDKGEVADAYRVERGWQTVSFLCARGARVLIVSHMGEAEESLAPVAQALKKFGNAVFIPDTVGQMAQHAALSMKDGEIALLENLRRDPREKANDESFAKELAALADIYVDDAFAAAHRAHASIVGVPKFLPHYGGLLMKEEIEHLAPALSPQSPSVAILGGAKFETKAPLIKFLLQKYDHVFIAGALANDVLKALGYEVGVSRISAELPGKDVLEHPHFLAPADVTVVGPDKQAKVKQLGEVNPDEMIVDIGPDSVAKIGPFIAEAKYILWNGPTGLYENGFTAYTGSIAKLVEGAVARGASSVIGGGDTLAAIAASGVSEKGLGFLSTGGGAMLEYLLKGSLPGIDALH